MARRFGRSWSSALALALFFITFATYYTLQPLRNAPNVLVEPESGVVLDDPGSAKDKEDGKEIEHTNKEAEKTTHGYGWFATGTNQVYPPSSPMSIPALESPKSQVPPIPASSKQPVAESTKTKTASEPSTTPQPKAQATKMDTLEAPEETQQSSNETNSEDMKPDHPPEGYAVEEGSDQSNEEPDNPPPPSKMIVMGKLSTEDTDWVHQELTDWQNRVYVVDLEPGVESPTGHRTKMNKAREAMPYLTYIVNHYPDFPDVVAFIHPHRRGMPMAWHNDARGNDAVNMMRDLRIDTVLDRGYVNLRCNNEVGCPDEVQPFRDPPDPNKYAEQAFPYVYGHFFNASFTRMRETIPVVATQCCAQFAVSKKQLLKRPKHEYVRYRKFLEETHYDDATVGRVMEYLWHIIFGREAVHCENVFDCWCAVYGRCFGHGRSGAGGRGWHP